MSKTIILKEYEEITKNKNQANNKVKYNEILDNANCDLDKLQSYLKCHNLDTILNVTRHGIMADSWVGVIKYKKHQFQILPKLICDNDNAGNILRNLIFMLSYVKKLQIKTSDIAKLSTAQNPFLEVLIREYANSLFECLKRITPKKYVREEDNLNYLKGKIKFTENIRYNNVNQAKFYCEYDEYSENNILNQLFLFVSTCLYNIANDSFNKKILKFIINYYNDIKLVRFDKFKVEKIRLSRNQESFRKPFNLAKMFIENTSVDLSKNKFENITLIWDMNKLFEEFIYEFMKRKEDKLGWTIIAQNGKRLLETKEGKRRNSYVDIYAESSVTKQKIIIDTKYKEFKNLSDVANADIFQVSTYCLLHNTNHAVLLYPQFGEHKLELPQHYLNNGKQNYRIDFKTVNLQYDYIGTKENLENIKDEIEKILKEE